jgi:hypothetical protein
MRKSRLCLAELRNVVWESDEWAKVYLGGEGICHEQEMHISEDELHVLVYWWDKGAKNKKFFYRLSMTGIGMEVLVPYDTAPPALIAEYEAQLAYEAVHGRPWPFSLADRLKAEREAAARA